MSLEIWTYNRCGTCTKAKRWLEQQGIDFSEQAIRDNPPSAELLSAMLSNYDGKRSKICNTSSADYRAVKDELLELSDSELCKRLSETGNLIKRPFVVNNGNAVCCGFKEDIWVELFG